MDSTKGCLFAHEEKMATIGPPRKISKKYVVYACFLVRGKNCLKWLRMGPLGFFVPANLDPADIFLGNTDFDFEDFLWGDFC